jgi:mono/diheme cytochrome c family protein
MLLHAKNTRPSRCILRRCGWVIAVVLSLGGCHPSEPSSESTASPSSALTKERVAATEQAPTTRPILVNGGALFQQYCQACHGAQGTGGMGPALNAVGSKGLEHVEKFVSQGSPGNGMPAFQVTLSPAEIKAVAGYVVGLTGQPLASPPPAKPPDH